MTARTKAIWRKAFFETLAEIRLDTPVRIGLFVIPVPSTVLLTWLSTQKFAWTALSAIISIALVGTATFCVNVRKSFTHRRLSAQAARRHTSESRQVGIEAKEQAIQQLRRAFPDHSIDDRIPFKLERLKTDADKPPPSLDAQRPPIRAYAPASRLQTLAVRSPAHRASEP